MDEIAPQDDSLSLALPNGQCAERFFLRRVYRDAEFTFWLADGTECTGYVTAFDNNNIQMSTSDENPMATLIPWMSVIKIDETDVRLSAKSYDFQEKIKSYTRAIKNQAHFILTGKTRPARLPFDSPTAL